MTDRELLELAAKAVGIRGPIETLLGGGLCILTEKAQFGMWAPLSADGDALKLAVDLRLTVAVRHNECEVFEDGGECLTSEPIFTASAFIKPEQATDPYAATRRAIVRAAAEIGKGMP